MDCLFNKNPLKYSVPEWIESALPGKFVQGPLPTFRDCRGTHFRRFAGTTPVG